MVLLNQWADNPSLMLAPDIWTANRSLSASIPVHAFYNAPNTTAQCVQSGVALNSVDCEVIRANAAYALNFATFMANTTAGGSVVTCDNCDGFLVSGNNVPWIVNHILNLVGHLTV